MKKLLIPVILLVVVASTLSCSSRSSVTPTATPPSTPPTTTPPPAQVTVNPPRVTVQAPPPAATTSAPSPVILPDRVIYGPTPTPTPTPAPTPTTPPISGTTAQQANDITARLIVRNGNMLVMVDDFKNAIAQITTLTEQKKGFVVSSQVPQIQQGATGSIIIRVPADEFENTMKAINDLVVEVKSQSTSANDVTQEYTDLNSRLTNLLATEQQFLVILGKATTVTDILAVQKELSNTRQNIEVTKGQIQYLQQTSSTSLISVTLQQSKLIIKISPDRPLANVDEPIGFSVDITGGFTPFSYQWDFGDKVTSTQSNPVHTYASSGDRKVTLKVTDNKGNVATDQRTMTIFGGWDAGSVARTAWHGLVMFGRVLLNVLIWLGIFSPVWLIGGGITIFFIRRSRKKK